MEKIKLSLAHLYPKLLNLYGDLGNVLTLKKRCNDRGIELEINEIDLGQNIEEHDIYFIGGGQDKQQECVSADILKYKEFLFSMRDDNAVFLGICGGYQLLGHYYQTQNENELAGLGLLDIYTLAGDKRFIGNVVCETDFLEPKTLVGFENHSGLTYLQNDTKPLARIIRGHGNDNKGAEGAYFKNVFGTYLHGPLLPKNPHFADHLISLAIEKKYGEKIQLAPLEDGLEVKTHNFLRGYNGQG